MKKTKWTKLFAKAKKMKKTNREVDSGLDLEEGYAKAWPFSFLRYVKHIV
jgi:hypothetical protein